MVPTVQAQPSFVKAMQGPNEPYTDFLARLRVAVERAVGRDEISEILQTLAFENADPECKRILGPLKGQGASIAEYIRACSGVGGTEPQANVFATALAKAMRPQKGGNCFHCGKPGHMKIECQKLKAGIKVQFLKTDLLLGRIRLLLDFAVGAGRGFIGLMNADLKQTKWATRYRETILRA